MKRLLIGCRGVTLLWMGCGDVRSSPVIEPDGTIYVGSYDGYLYAIYGTGTLANANWPMVSS